MYIYELYTTWQPYHTGIQLTVNILKTGRKGKLPEKEGI